MALLFYSMARAGVADGFTWQWQTLDAEGASISLPGRPLMEKNPARVPGPSGSEVELQITSYHLVKDQMVFGLATVSLPAEYSALPPEQILDGSRESALSHANGRLLYERHLQWKGDPLREVVMRLPDGNVAEVRVVLRGRQVVQLTAIHPPERFSGAVERFFDSLRLPARR